MPSWSSPITSGFWTTLFPISCTCSKMGESRVPAEKNWHWSWSSADMTGWRMKEPSWTSVPIMQTLTSQNHAPETDPYLEKFQRFEKEGAGKHPSWLFPIRKAGIARFAELGFPTLKDEDWRFTNVAPIARLPFKPVFDYSPAGLNEKILSQFHFAGLKCNRLVFVNGLFSEALSSVLPQKPGVKLGSLAAALAQDSDTLENILARPVRGGQNAFAALNTA